MFYEGTLQEGISTAVGQQKLVFCFVTNDNDESKTWETEFLQDPSLKDVIAKQAVALRLQAGSEEAGYLSQIFPLPQTPTIVIMKHGELKEYIAAGTSKEDFFRRVQSSFNIAPRPATPPSPQQLSSSPPSASTPAGVPADIERSDTVRRVLEERAAKLQAEKAAAEQKAKDERSKAKGKAKAEAEAGADTDGARAHKQAELVKKKKQQDSEERKRILKRIEDDKEARRQRAAEREQQRIDNQSIGDVASALSSSPATKLPSTTRLSEMTAIQVRLFDGSTIRSRFKTASPVTEVRKWVDETRSDGKLPYTFKQLLTPLPNRSIDQTEEEQSIGDVGLAPSSTLILIPIRSFVSAYENPSQGLVSRIIGMILGFFTWLLGLIGLGGGRTDNPSPSASEQTGPSAAAQDKDRRIKGFQNPNDRRKDHQLYNGNSLNFEPRPDEDETE